MLDQPTVTVRWSSDDATAISYLQPAVQQGRRCDVEIVAQYLQGDEVELDAANIGRTDQGKFRVLVTDGVHTSSDDSDGVFTVPNRVPSAKILEPNGPVTIARGQTLSLEGDAYDVDTGTLFDEQVQWSSSIDGVLGSGVSLSISTLTVGTHTISFRADDGEGGVTTTTVEVTVVPNIDDLPPVPDNLLVGPVLLTLTTRSTLPLSIENENPVTTLTWDASASEPWVRLSASSGMTPSEIEVALDPALPAGRYTASITVNSTAGSRTVMVEATGGSCVGDCDNSGNVAINELVLGVNIALGSASLAQCPALNVDGNDSVGIAELIQAVNAALKGC